MCVCVCVCARARMCMCMFVRVCTYGDDVIIRAKLTGHLHSPFLTPSFAPASPALSHLQDTYHLYFLFDLMPGGDLMDVLVAEAKVGSRAGRLAGWLAR